MFEFDLSPITLETNNLVYFGSPGLAQNINFGYAVIMLKLSAAGTIKLIVNELRYIFDNETWLC